MRCGRKQKNSNINNASKRHWCGREDSNFHGSYPTATSTLRVYQFRHDRKMFRKPPSHAKKAIQGKAFRFGALN
jgi:hypothetical protein